MAKLVPVWEVVEKTLAEKGIKVSPSFTLKLCRKITREINRELEESEEHEGRLA